MGGTFAFSTAAVPCAAAVRAPGFFVHSLAPPRLGRGGGCGGGAAVAPQRQRRRQEGAGGDRSRRLAPPLAKKQREGEWVDDEEEHLGAAFRATLSMLDWGRLCGQVGGAEPARAEPGACAGGGACATYLQLSWQPTQPLIPQPELPLPALQVATFAQTTLGQRAVAGMMPPPTQKLSERALQETRAGGRWHDLLPASLPAWMA